MMRGRAFSIAKSVVVAASIAAVIWVGAGELSPPAGPISPTMKTLDQVQPRIPIIPANKGAAAAQVPRGATPVSCPGTITASGSYYLTGNCNGVVGQHGIIIDANDVTVDLSGFCLDGGGPGSGTLAGITILSGRENIAVKNGTVQGWGAGGVVFSTSDAVVDICQLSDLRALVNMSYGIRCGTRCMLVNCTAANTTASGARSVEGNGIFLTSGTVSGCSATGNAGSGIVVAERGIVHGCTASSNGAHGIVCDESTLGDAPCMLDANTATGNAEDGIRVRSYAYVLENTSTYNTAAGVRAMFTRNRLEDNQVIGNGTGIDVDGCGNLVVRNTTAGNTVEYDIRIDSSCIPDPANQVGIIQTAYGPSVGSWDNFDY
jgi:parallel beta-helix repeat protein